MDPVICNQQEDIKEQRLCNTFRSLKGDVYVFQGNSVPEQKQTYSKIDLLIHSFECM